MGEWLANVGASWGTSVALFVALILAADGIRRLIRGFARKRINRDELHIEEFRRAVDELLVELENAATGIESRIASRLDRLAEAERQIDEKLRRLALIQTASEGNQTRIPDAPAMAAARPQPQAAEFAPATQPQLTIAARPAARERENRSRRPGRFARSTPDESQTALFARIRQMAEDGSSSAAIAETLRIPLGEVETYLALRQLAR